MGLIIHEMSEPESTKKEKSIFHGKEMTKEM